MRITILAENTVVFRNALGEHGFAAMLDTGNTCLLFDTGQGRVLAENARVLNADLDAVDTIVLSHGHDDHTGGLAEVLSRTGAPVTVYAHPDALLPKFQARAGIHDISMPVKSREILRSKKCRFKPSRVSLEILPAIHTTGEVPRLHAEETSTERFCLDPQGAQPDLLLDDQSLFIDAAQGTVVLLGCAHAGLINTLDYIQKLTGGRPIEAVIGGTHLRSASNERMAWTIQELRRFNIKFLAPMHCTGQKSAAALWTAFPNACRNGGAGTVFEF